MTLHQVIYVSQAVGGAGGNLLSMAEILGVSDRNNRRDHVSGCLICHEGRFLQVIEGSRTDLDMLLIRLRGDPRHTKLRVLADQLIAQRRIEWPMSQASVTPEVEALLADTTLGTISANRVESLLASIMKALPQPV